jgi:type II secretory pathway pseudopilin PulG
MIFSKLIKWRKLIVCVIVILGVALYFVANHHTGQIDTQQIQHTVNASSYIKDVQTVDRNMVIKVLKSKAELVSNSGIVEKHYTYSDSIFKDHGYIKDLLGQRSLDVLAKGYFKTGIDLSSISSDNIVTYGQTIFVKLPKDQMQLISLDVPFNEMGFVEKSGIFRSQLSLQDKQVLYEQIRNTLQNEIMNNDEIKDKTYNQAAQVLQNLLEKIPNCNKIVIQPKLI